MLYLTKEEFLKLNETEQFEYIDAQQKKVKYLLSKHKDNLQNSLLKEKKYFKYLLFKILCLFDKDFNNKVLFANNIKMENKNEKKCEGGLLVQLVNKEDLTDEFKEKFF